MREYAYIGCRTTKERNARGKGIRVYEIIDGTWTLRPVSYTHLDVYKRQALSAILELSPVKQALASKQLKSVYLDRLLSMQEERKQKKRDAQRNK